MIRINLVPIEELENQYWYVPDVAVLLIFVVASYLGAQHYLGKIQEQIDLSTDRLASLEQSTQQLKPDLARFENLKTEIMELNNKLTALKTITVSKIAKYKPVIAVEHFQNLKPEGVWYVKLEVMKPHPTDESRPLEYFELTGQAFDNLLVAELLTAIKSTASQEDDKSDLRTQVYFSEVTLEESIANREETRVFEELRPYPRFVIRGRIVERGQEGTAPAMPNEAALTTAAAGGSGSDSSF